MKVRAVAWLACLWALLASAAPAQAIPPSTERVVISGKEFTRLTSWARSNRLEAGWIKREETLLLHNDATRIVVSVDSCEARVNGVQVRLLYPVTARNGFLYFAQLDADRTLGPLLHSPKYPPGTRIKTVCLDAGHGGRDPGNLVGSRQEKKYTLLLAQELRQQLTRAGFKVTLTRSTDTFVDLPERPEKARRRGADILLSLHFNSAATAPATVQGAEVYCLTPAGAPSSNSQGEIGNASACSGNRWNDRNLLLAYHLQKSLVQNLGSEDRGVHRARFAVLREATMPAALVEAGFMSHPAEGRKIFDPAYRQKVARAITQGLLDYKRLVQRSPAKA